MGLLHFATGDVLREAVEKGTPEGRKAKPFMTSGQLVPDEIVNDIINARFRDPTKPQQFVLDGYPRTLAQALSLDAVLTEQALDLDAVILLSVDDDEIVHRLGNRWTCPNSACKAVYHAFFNPPKRAGVCDLCHTALHQRDDDKPATIRKRLQVYHEFNDALIRLYRNKGLLIEVPGRGDIESIYADIIKSLSAAKG
jgi:adenylate kinase